MKCSRCGKQVGENEKFCRYCGNPLRTPGEASGGPGAGESSAPDMRQPEPAFYAAGGSQKPERKRKWIIGAVIAAAAAAALAVFLLFWNSAESRLNRALSSGDYAAAVEIWNGGLEEDVIEDTMDTFRSALLDIYGRYADGEADSEEVLDQMAVFEAIRDKRLSDLALAAELLVQGDEAMSDGAYRDAVENYREALDYDPELQPVAERLSEAETGYREEIIENAESYAEQEAYEEALQEIQDAMTVLEDDEALKEKEEEITEDYEEYKKQHGAVSVEFRRENTEDYMEYAVITGLNDQGEAVWSVNTEEYASTELERTTGIGLRDDVYYYVEGGTLTALKLEDGTVLWKNSEFGGAGAASAFGENGEIYLCGYYGPDFFAVDEEGNTLCRIDTFDPDYYWAHQIQCESGQAVVSMAGSPSGEEVQITVDLSDFSYRLPDNAGNSGVSAGQAMSLEQICRAVEAHYNSENNTDEYVVFESECMETEDGYILLLRSQGGSSANVLVGAVQVNTGTGEVQDDWGESWSLF